MEERRRRSPNPLSNNLLVFSMVVVPCLNKSFVRIMYLHIYGSKYDNFNILEVFLFFFCIPTHQLPCDFPNLIPPRDRMSYNHSCNFYLMDMHLIKSGQWKSFSSTNGRRRSEWGEGEEEGGGGLLSARSPLEKVLALGLLVMGFVLLGILWADELRLDGLGFVGQWAFCWTTGLC